MKLLRNVVFVVLLCLAAWKGMTDVIVMLGIVAVLDELRSIRDAVESITTLETDLQKGGDL